MSSNETLCTHDPHKHVELTLAFTFIILGSLILLIVCSCCAYRFMSYHRLLAARDEALMERVREALQTTRVLTFTAAFIRASDFLAMGELKSYETIRDAGLHVYRDRYASLRRHFASMVGEALHLRRRSLF